MPFWTLEVNMCLITFHLHIVSISKVAFPSESLFAIPILSKIVLATIHNALWKAKSYQSKLLYSGHVLGWPWCCPTCHPLSQSERRTHLLHSNSKCVCVCVWKRERMSEKVNVYMQSCLCDCDHLFAKKRGTCVWKRMKVMFIFALLFVRRLFVYESEMMCLKINIETESQKKEKKTLIQSELLNIFTVSYSISALSSKLGQSHFIPH